MAKKFDNIDLDMIDADRLGYGVQYGRFKADQPFTKEANEPRLSGKKKIQMKKVYAKTCPVCGMQFTTTNNKQLYCGENCKAAKGKTKWHRRTDKK
jgi:hypothetical protein